MQAQSLPQLHGPQSHLFASLLVHAQGGVQRHAWLMVWSVIGTSWVSGCRLRRFRPASDAALERKGYVMRSVAGATPNIRLNVRLKCEESAKPASCADCVNDAPAARRSRARVSRSHRR